MRIKEAKTIELELYILRAAIQSGINGELDELTRNVVTEFLVSQFGNMYLSEYKEAFECYAAKKLEFQSEAYNNLSPKFIGNVLASWKEWRRKENLKVPLIGKETLKLENKQDPIHEQKRAFEFIKEVYNKDGNPPLMANYSEAFKHCEREGLIKMDKTAKIELFNLVKSKFEMQSREVKSSGDTKRFNKFVSENLNKPSIALECQRISIIKLLQNESKKTTVSK